MKNLEMQSVNVVNIVGKLVNMTFRQGTSSTGKPYESVSMVIRVTQNVDNKKETSEIPISIFATQYTNAGKLNPLYDNVQKAKKLRSIQDYGQEMADTVRLSRGNIQENYYISNSGQLFDGWQLRGSFCSPAAETATELATFSVEMFIMDMHDELDYNGEPTGRLVVRGALVQYGNKVDILDFIVEDPDKIDYLQRNWEVNQTVKASGRIRVKAEESVKAAKTSSWGEEISEETTRVVRELIITGGSDEGLDEDFSYDPDEIRKGYNERKAAIEQKQIEARNGSNSSKPSQKKAQTKYDWE